ncbi:MAG: hypothetical protein AAFZ65_16980 [Planctomycetota bacterium]
MSLIGGALALALLLAGPEARVQDHVQRVAAALELAETDADAAARELELLAGRAPKVLLERLAATPATGPSGLPSGIEAELLARALARLPQPTLVDLLQVDQEHSVAARRARLAVLSESRSREALDLALTLVSNAERPAALTSALQATATALHRRRDDVGELLAARIPRVELELVGPLAEALASVDRDESTVQLAQLVGSVEPLDPFLLGVIASRAARSHAPLPTGAVESARRALESGRDATRREALIAAARLDDYESVPRLIELLDDPHPGVAENARWALEHLSHLHLDGEALRWRTWYELNHRWWLEEWPALEAALLHGNHQETVDALREVAGRSFERVEIARVTARVLDRTNDPSLLAYTCLALGTLRTSGIAPRVAPLLADPRPEVRQAAHRSLRSLTGLDLAPEASLWSDALAGDAR